MPANIAALSHSTIELDQSIAEVVSHLAVERPDAVAIEDGERRVTYAELDAAAGRIAAGVRAAGIDEGEPVAVCLPRSWQAVCAFLGILRAGAAYVPLGTAQPAVRLERMLTLAGAELALTSARHRAALPGGMRTLEIEALAEGGRFGPPAPRGGDRLAYILFTSGSTGEPKGVEITEGNLAHALANGAALLPEPNDVVLGIAPVEFDIAAWEVWGALSAGARLVLAPPGRPDPRDVGRLIADRRITYAFFAAGLFEQVVRAALPDLGGMRLIAAGGDVMSPAAAGALRSAHPSVRLLNVYGPTETSIVASYYEVEPADEGPLPIGRPLPGYTFHVLDMESDPVETGKPGELWIGGAGVGRGYSGDPERTAERFQTDVFSRRAGARMYRTGDRVRLREDGELLFLGRLDDQVKIAGHRVEPGEVEQALGAHPAVRHAAVVAREDVPGHKRLIGYVALRDGDADRDGLFGHLRERLPAYMLPAELEILPQLPLTERGKIDRGALPRPRRSHCDSISEGAAAAIARMVGELLDLDDIGPNEDFFALGGDSLLALQLVGRLRDRFDADLDIGAVFDAPTARLLAVRAEAAVGRLTKPPLRRSHATGPTPATFAQRRAWLFERLNPDSLAYQFACVIHLDGSLDEEALEDALRDLMRRHEAFRTGLVERGGEPVQVVEEHVPLPLERIDLRGQDDRCWARLVRERVRTRIELASAPLVRWTLVRRGPQSWSLIDVEHHVVHDGWSLMIVLSELAELYSARTESRQARLPEQAVQLADFARWERRALGPARERRQLDFWRRRLQADPPLLELPIDRPRTRRESFQGGSIRRRLDPALARQVRELAGSEGATLFMACFAAFAAVLARISGETRLQIGSGLAGRSDPAAESLVGMVVATVALPIDVSGDPSVRELLRRARNTVLDCVANSDVPFERVVEALDPPRRPGRSPLVQAFFSFDDTPARESHWGGLRAQVVQTIPNGTAKADLNVIGVDHGDGSPFFIWEHSELFDDATVDRLAGYHLRLLQQFVKHPDAHISELEVMSRGERELIAEASVGRGGYDRLTTLHGLVERSARRAPSATAVVDGERRLDYGELLAAAGSVAASLRGRGVRDGDRVGVLLGRSADAVAAQLGVLTAGAAYVPLDPQHPPTRIARVLDDAGAAVVLSDGALRRRLPIGVAIVPIDDALQAEPIGSRPREPRDLAYVIYTSGSTGEPKGVEVTHGNVVRLVDDPGYADLGTGTVMLHAASPAFDAATLEIWGPLANGGTVACLGEQPSPEAIATAIGRDGVTTLWLTAGLFHELVDRRPDCLAEIRQLLAGGDVLDPDHVRRALAALPPDAKLINGYGPTEATTFTTTYELRPGDPVEQPIPIGQPIQGTVCRVVDADGVEVPLGAAGELEIGGDGVARGYRGDPELTAARFRSDPDRPGGRRYLSGDRVRWRADGTLEFLGRRDRQLKLRGVRVEPAEVEEALRAHPEVADAAVVPFERVPGDLALAAYFVPATAPPCGAEELRARAAAMLPATMVPAAWVELSRLPLTANGKLDRERLPPPGPQHLPRAANSTPPRDRLERRVVACFERVLGIGGVGAEDDFFALGGHSLLAVSLFAELERIGGRQLALATIFEAPTPRALAERLRSGPASSDWDNLVALKPGGSRPPLFVVAAGDGNIVGFGPLAQAVSAPQPLYALQPSGLDGRHPLDEGIEAMAERYVEALRAVQPHGPYLLAGRCNGATVAYEMAQLLRAEGEDVPLLAALDSDPPAGGPRELASGLPYDPIMESAWMRARETGDEPPVPGEDDSGAVAAWLAEPLAPGVSRYLHEAWRWRDDLRQAWPDPLGGDARSLAEWGWDHGPREMGLSRRLLLPRPARAEPPRERLRRARALGSRLLREQLTEGRRRALDALERGLERPLPEARQRTERRVVAAARRARERYRAKPWPGRVLLVTSTEFERKPTYPAWELRALGGVERVSLPVGHVEMLRRPAPLASCLESAIAEVLSK